jgi:hypothetical protein
MAELDFGKPMRTFYRNLKAWGFRLSLDAGGGLVVESPPAGCPPLLAQAIIDRRAWLVKLVELDGLLGRPLLDDDAARCRQLAQETGTTLSWENYDFETNQIERDIFNGEAAPDGYDEQERLAELNEVTA